MLEYHKIKMIKYKYIYNVIICDRFCSNFMQKCDLGVTDVGVEAKVSFISQIKPTKESIENFKNLIEKSKEEKSLDKYYTNVKYVEANIIMEDEDE